MNSRILCIKHKTAVPLAYLSKKHDNDHRFCRRAKFSELQQVFTPHWLNRSALPAHKQPLLLKLKHKRSDFSPHLHARDGDVSL